MRTIKFYEAVDIIDSGSIYMNGTRRKLYNYATVEGDIEYLKKYIEEHPNKTVFSMGKLYAPELRRIAIATKAHNFDKWATDKDREQFEVNRTSFLK